MRDEEEERKRKKFFFYLAELSFPVVVGPLAARTSPITAKGRCHALFNYSTKKVPFHDRISASQRLFHLICSAPSNLERRLTNLAMSVS